MISLETSLKHLAWSNQTIYSFFANQPDEVFALKTAESEWPIGEILTHLAGSGEWYRYCLTEVLWTDLKPVTSGAVAREYLAIMTELDAVLLQHCAGPNKDLKIQGENGLIHATTSLILSQSVMHAAEHKGQIAAIMKHHGHHLDLDALDVWSFIAESKNK
jgi:uncharacterized damage-inducible protein DinB